MRLRIFKSMLVVLLVASGLSFAVGEARAAIGDSYAFPILKYNLTFMGITPGSGTNLTSAKYLYRFASTGSSTISNIDFEIPAAISIPPGTYPATACSPTANVCVSFGTGTTGMTPVSFEIFAPGTGDSGTKLGTGDTRYSVLKINANSSSFPKDFYIALDIMNQTIGPRLPYGLGFKPQVVLVKSGNGQVWDTGTINAPSPADPPPPPPPPVPTVSLSASPNTVDAGMCADLLWNSTDASSVVISSIGLVTASPTRVCPANTTTYTITAMGIGGSATATATVTVNSPAPPQIEIARNTIEKKDGAGNITGNITFYFANGLPACSCVTNPGDLILDFPCNQQTLPANCNRATDTGENPLLMCIPFPGQNPDFLRGTCLSYGSQNCTVVPITCTDAFGQPVPNCYARCDNLEFATSDTTVEVGPHSCTLTTYPCRKANGSYGICYSYSGLPCP